ncbi:hypothetical protein [Metamycoplasma canadense]|nr:hypothetical protein [Metamycoplasma canadense]
MKIKRMTHRLKLILLTIFIFFLFLFFIVILIIKFLNPYKVVIYNYESYLEKEIITKIKKNYSYRVFKNLDEFTRDIKNKKAVAGVSSDYQIAQLILEDKLKKINFKKAYNIDFNKQNKKEKIYSLYSPEVIKQFEYYNNWIIDQIKKINPQNNKNQTINGSIKPYLYYDKQDTKKIIGFEIDGDEGIDHFYEFLIPYFTLDKVIAYNPQEFDIYKKTRNSIKKNQSFDDIKNGISWFEALSKLTNKYNNPRIYWTNWFLDNAMIGQFYQYSSGDLNQKNNHGNWVLFNKNNYKDSIDNFNKLVIDSTGKSIKDISRNKLVTDGQELVSSIIEPSSKKADIAIMYNGDALDAYYGKDNFESLEEKNNISFIRPNFTYANIDAWIISKDTDQKSSDNLLSKLNEYIFSDIIKSEKEIENTYINNVFQEIIKNLNNEEKKFKNKIFNSLFNSEKNAKNLNEIPVEFFEKNYDAFRNAFSYDNLPNIKNFDTINYTPSYKNIKNFLTKWYFLDNKKQPDLKAISIYDMQTAKNVEFRPYQPLDLELKTKMIEYYYQKTKS